MDRNCMLARLTEKQEQNNDQRKATMYSYILITVEHWKCEFPSMVTECVWPLKILASLENCIE